MAWRRFETFLGGIVLPDDKRATRGRAIAAAPVPRRLRVPLDVCGLGDATAEVGADTVVRAGERIGIAGGRLPVFSPVDGIVWGLATAELAGEPPGTTLCQAVEIVPSANQSLAAAEKAAAPAAEVAAMEDPDTILEQIAAAGLVTCSRPVMPLADWVEAARTANADTIIANGLENEPCLTADHRMLIEHGASVVDGLLLAARAIGASRAALAVDVHSSGRYRRAAERAEELGVEALALERKYPAGHPVMLTRIITRRTVRPGGKPLEVRVGVLDIATCLAISRCITTGEPMTRRVVTVAGRGASMPGNYLLPLGTPAGDALAIERVDPAAGALVWCGGPMTGARLEGDRMVIGPASSAVLVLPASGEQPPSVCIRCGWCTDQCPVRLNVAELNDLYELGQVSRAARYDVQACIGCGVCSYVCPASIPLAARMTRLKMAAKALGPTAPRRRAHRD
jgi:electron transport complex protein RnfC